uniref:Uncharacterized protein n=1 Tax=Tetradesmus obliquus TaxID=3088 RepID=A0A383VR63_TETOB|eukprot:jgi/Sobl393_1/10965/SZX68015.1
MHDLTDLGQQLDTALAASASPGNIRLSWSGAAAASCLHLQLQYDRQDFVPALFRLPPFGEMEVQQGAAFNAANARVLDVLTQQNSSLQQATSLLQTKLQELASHAQRVHESYCDAVDSMAAQPGHDYTPGSILDRTAAAAAAAAAEPASKRQRVGEMPLAGLSPGGATPSSASRLDAAAAAAAAAAAGSQLPFSLLIAPPLPPAAAAAAAAAAGGTNVGMSRPLITPTKKGKPKQLSSHERMLHRVASGHRRLQQDWNGWLRQLLQAQDTAEAQQAVAGRLGGQQQQQQQQRGGLAAAGSGQLAQQQQQQLEHGSPEAPSITAAAAAATDEEVNEPLDEDDDVAIRIVHKPRAKKHAGGPIFGTLKGKQHPAAREGSNGPAGA